MLDDLFDNSEMLTGCCFRELLSMFFAKCECLMYCNYLILKRGVDMYDADQSGQVITTQILVLMTPPNCKTRGIGMRNLIIRHESSACQVCFKG